MISPFLPGDCFENYVPKENLSFNKRQRPNYFWVFGVDKDELVNEKCDLTMKTLNNLKGQELGIIPIDCIIGSNFWVILLNG